jgi:uncharacterized membrane-anchored protein
MKGQNSSTTQLGNRRAARDPSSRGLGIKILTALSLAIAIYGLAEWLYVAVCSLVIPTVLPLPLTHLLPFLREDTSGVLSFALSFLGFAIYRILRDF